MKKHLMKIKITKIWFIIKIILTWLVKPTPKPSKIRPKMSMKIFWAAALMAPPAKKMQPPKIMVFLRPNVVVTRLAKREDINPARWREDVNSVNNWLSYTQYTFVSALADFLSIDGKNSSRNGFIVVTPPEIRYHHFGFN